MTNPHPILSHTRDTNASDIIYETHKPMSTGALVCPALAGKPAFITETISADDTHVDCWFISNPILHSTTFGKITVLQGADALVELMLARRSTPRACDAAVAVSS